MYIKNYLVTKCNLSASVIRGFFLLPEVMDSVISSESERSNLYCNAYATIREIDAFMQKAFGTLDERYDKLKFAVPKAGNRYEVDYYDQAPFDFCFLFSRENIESEKMKSKDDILEHASNCIYAQSIGPTNSRQNSSEDNTILERVRSKGRNNYCGAGASTLEYPYEDVKSYIAYKWAKNMVNKDWLEIDKEYIEKRRGADEAKDRGSTAIGVDRGKHYINTVDLKNEIKEPFPRQIYRDGRNYDPSGYVVLSKKWEDFVEALVAHVETETAGGLEAVEAKGKELLTLGNNLKSKKDGKAKSLQTLVSYLKQYHAMAESNSVEVAESMADSLYLSRRKPLLVTSRNQDYILENMFFNISGEAVHPCSMRYILYNTAEILIEEIAALKNSQSDFEELWKKFLTSKYKDKSASEQGGKDKYVSPETYISQSLLANVKGRGNKAQQETSIDAFIDDVLKLHGGIEEYIKTTMKRIVLEAALTYTRNLSESFEKFFSSLLYDVERIEKNIEQIEKKYPDLDGEKPVRYVCATKDCLDYLSRKAVNTNSSTNLPSKLCGDVYDKVLAYSMIKDKENLAEELVALNQLQVEKEDVLADKDIIVDRNEQQVENYFQDLFNKTIMDFWKKEVATQCNSLINMNVIEAIETEGEILSGTYSEKDKAIYVKRVIDDAKNLALPFIDAPLNTQPRIIDSCCFNPSLLDTDSSSRVQLVTDELINFGGVTSRLTPKSTVVFFRSIYNLKATDFRRFAPPTSSETLERKAGNYFSAYYDRVKRISAEDEEANDVTPHIHKAWHLVVTMPDLNPDYQEVLEKDICKAFVLSLLYDFVDYRCVDRIGESFVYELAFNQHSSRNADYSGLNKLTVKNGKACEYFYELFDAITLNPLVVDAVNNVYKEYIQIQQKQKTRFDEGEFVENLDRLGVKEFEETYKGDIANKLSIFALPIFYKTSCPTVAYYEIWAKRMVDSIFELIKDNISAYENEEEIENYYALVIAQQGRRLIKNLTSFESTSNSMLQTMSLDPLCVYIMTAIIDQLKLAGRFNEANKFKDLWDQYKHDSSLRARTKGEESRKRFLED